MKLTNIKALYEKALSVFGFKKILIALGCGFTCWCIGTTTALIIVPDNPQVIEQITTKNINNKETI